ncbi:unnamed protein product [Rotaria sp. Silwood2]|nr:unnamed protein product [Rotaria sp. Silwood2]CAF3114117.1 unnamed protein product [Rotaria sp. Silwood2]CAF4052849.1 unnamed protein product [Rotaria sp. Silwood2]CAF4142330.1 unnamed protein product [Rotaria sp. Silwood2]
MKISNVVLVWFDPHAEDNAIIDYRLTKRTLAEAFDNNELYYFFNQAECITFLKDRQDTAKVICLVYLWSKLQ